MSYVYSSQKIHTNYVHYILLAFGNLSRWNNMQITAPILDFFFFMWWLTSSRTSLFPTGWSAESTYWSKPKASSANVVWNIKCETVWANLWCKQWSGCQTQSQTNEINSQERQRIIYLNSDWLIHFELKPCECMEKKISNEEFCTQKYDYYCLWLFVRTMKFDEEGNKTSTYACKTPMPRVKIDCADIYLAKVKNMHFWGF